MKKTKLHLGCFNRKIHGYINIDIREDVEPDVVDDVFVLSNFEKESVDEIYVCHVLEHASRENSKKALTRWYEILKPNGIIRISVPDLEAMFEYYLNTKDLKSISHLLYGSQRHAYDFHYTGWDEQTLKKDLLEIGFSQAERYNWQETEHFYIDDYSQCYLPKISYSSRRIGSAIDGKLVSLNIKAIK